MHTAGMGDGLVKGKSDTQLLSSEQTDNGEEETVEITESEEQAVLGTETDDGEWTSVPIDEVDLVGLIYAQARQIMGSEGTM